MSVEHEMKVREVVQEYIRAVRRGSSYVLNPDDMREILGIVQADIVCDLIQTLHDIEESDQGPAHYKAKNVLDSF
jgi:hypothetical protein